MPRILEISLAAILFENFVLVRLLGICPFLGVSKKVETAFGMGLSMIFMMGASSVAAYLANVYILRQFGLEYMSTVVFVLIITILAQLAGMFMKKVSPALYSSSGIYLPLITVNCAVLGAAFLSVEKGYNLLDSLVFGVTAGVGFTLAIVLLAGVRERIEHSETPSALKGFPITLISAGLIALAFLGFNGLKLF